MTIILFFGSTGLLAALVVLRFIEVGRGKRFFEGARHSLDNLSVRVIFFFSKKLPRYIAYWAHELLMGIVHIASLLLLKLVRVIEHELQRFIQMIRGRRRKVERRATGSSYLEQVASHKREVSEDEERGYYEE